LGRRAFLVHGSRTLVRLGVLEELAEQLSASGVEVIATTEARGEPTIEAVDRAAEQLFDFNPGPGDLVIALGGGAAIDFGKAIAAMSVIDEPVSVRDYLEGIGRGLSLPETTLPILAMPTTGGTGAEATRNAVIACADPPCKKSLRHDSLMPKIVLIDPELAVHAPASVTAHSGMDAITQLLESYVTPRANAVTREGCVQGLRLALPALPIAFEDGTNVAARSEMALAALLSGMALANSGLGMAHGVAAALGALAGAPHGLACAVMLPVALRTNLSVCAPQLDELAEALSLGDAVGLIAAVVALSRRLGIPERLSALGVTQEQLPALAAASRGNSMSGNPRSLSDEELLAVLEENL
jgi:alcohol dehydrogenase class IV